MNWKVAVDGMSTYSTIQYSLLDYFSYFSIGFLQIILLACICQWSCYSTFCFCVEENNCQCTHIEATILRTMKILGRQLSSLDRYLFVISMPFVDTCVQSRVFVRFIDFVERTNRLDVVRAISCNAFVLLTSSTTCSNYSRPLYAVISKRIDGRKSMFHFFFVVDNRTRTFACCIIDQVNNYDANNNNNRLVLIV
jgi:hypothetical protein